MKKLAKFVPILLLPLAACGGGDSLNESQQSQYAELEGLLAGIDEEESSWCNIVQDAIDEGGMTFALDYSVEVLDHYMGEHC